VELNPFAVIITDARIYHKLVDHYFRIVGPRAPIRVFSVHTLEIHTDIESIWKAVATIRIVITTEWIVDWSEDTLVYRFIAGIDRADITVITLIGIITALRVINDRTMHTRMTQTVVNAAHITVVALVSEGEWEVVWITLATGLRR
jgi:hypothetical protein